MKYISLVILKPAMLILFSAILFNSCNKQNNSDLHQWRGDNRDGKYIETNLLNEWPEDGPEVLWAINGLGKGYAAPVITDDKIFINGEKDSMSYLFAFDLEGKLIWKVQNGEQFMGEGFSATYPGARSTPTVVGNLVYACSGKGRLICCNTENGELVWKVDMINDLDGYLPYFGIAESPLIDKDKIYCYPSGEKNNIVALNRQTGEPVWSSAALQDTASFCSPIFIELAERKIMVTMSHYYLMGLDTEDGKLLWKYDIQGYEAEGDHCNTPVYHEGNIYQVFGDRYSQGAVKLKLAADGSSVEEVWTNDKVKNNFSGFIMHDNLMFTTVRGNYLKTLELEKGLVRDSLKSPTGALIYSDNKFISYGYNGEVSLINYKDGQFNPGGSFRVELGDGQHFSHPVISKGIMYIRHGDAMLAYKIGEQG